LRIVYALKQTTEGELRGHTQRLRRVRPLPQSIRRAPHSLHNTRTPLSVLFIFWAGMRIHKRRNEPSEGAAVYSEDNTRTPLQGRQLACITFATYRDSSKSNLYCDYTSTL